MTTALCLYCGETKFGAFCPCGSCRAPSTGDHSLDILFSDHQMSVKSLKRFGELVKQLARNCDDDEVRFWAFISYLSDHPTQLLSAPIPEELTEQVRDLLEKAKLPIISVDLVPQTDTKENLVREIDIPKRLLDALQRRGKVASFVELRDRTGAIYHGFVMESDGMASAMVPVESDVKSEDFVAIRKEAGCLFGWFLRPKWITVEEEDRL